MSGRWWARLLQAVLAAAVAAFVWRAIAARWDEFRTLELTVRPDWPSLVGACVVVLATYGVLVVAWWTVLRGWGQAPPFRAALRVWSLSNLARYVPGKVWGVAGLAILAERAGAAGWAAVAAAVAIQALTLGTGVVVVAATLPRLASALQVTMALALSAATVAAVSVDRLAPRWIRRVRPSVEFRSLHVGAAAGVAGTALLSWLGYGVAFWLMARGLVGESALSLPSATGVFAAGYLVGLLALFAPGGIGVREVMLVGLLTPTLGAGGAVIVSVGSRLLLTVTEAVAAVLAIALDRPRPRGDG